MKRGTVEVTTVYPVWEEAPVYNRFRTIYNDDIYQVERYGDIVDLTVFTQDVLTHLWYWNTLTAVAVDKDNQANVSTIIEDFKARMPELIVLGVL